MGYTQDTAEQPLEQAIPFLPERDRAFALSLLQSWKTYGKLTEKQQLYADKFIAKVKDGPKVVAPEVLELEKLIDRLPVKDHGFARDLVRSCKVGDDTPNRLKWINTLLERARVAERGSARRLVIERVAAKVGLKPDTVDRVVRRLEKHVKDRPEEDLLAALESSDGKAALAAMAKKYGDATHNCCFCGLDLTDERSTSAGYGPICAGKYHLPWGTSPATPEEKSDAAA